MYLILTVQRVVNRHYRFGMSILDRNIIIPRLRGCNILIDLPGVERSEVRSVTFFRFGKLINTTISEWIIYNNYDHVPNQQESTKLVFRLRSNLFSFYLNQAH